MKLKRKNKNRNITFKNHSYEMRRQNWLKLLGRSILMGSLCWGGGRFWRRWIDGRKKDWRSRRGCGMIYKGTKKVSRELIEHLKLGRRSKVSLLTIFNLKKRTMSSRLWVCLMARQENLSQNWKWRILKTMTQLRDKSLKDQREMMVRRNQCQSGPWVILMRLNLLGLQSHRMILG